MFELLTALVLSLALYSAATPATSVQPSNQQASSSGDTGHDIIIKGGASPGEGGDIIIKGG